AGLVDAREQTPGLHRNAGVPVGGKGSLEPMRRLAQRLLHVTLPRLKAVTDIAGRLVQQRNVGLEPSAGIEERFERLDLRIDELESIFCEVAVLGHDKSDWLADVAHLVPGQRLLEEGEELRLGNDGRRDR